jgi:hypothetical protein
LVKDPTSSRHRTPVARPATRRLSQTEHHNTPIAQRSLKYFRHEPT